MAKDELLRFRVTAEEKGLIEAAAQRDGVPVSAWMVGTLVAAAGTKAALPSTGTGSTKLQAARRALREGEVKAAPLGKPAHPYIEDGPRTLAGHRSWTVDPPPVATLCSKHKRPLPCPSCAR